MAYTVVDRIEWATHWVPLVDDIGVTKEKPYSIFESEYERWIIGDDGVNNIEMWIFTEGEYRNYNCQ